MTDAPPRICPSCDADHAARLDAYSETPWDVVTCLDCGFVYLRNPPAYAALEEDYAWEKTFAEKKKKGGSTALSGTLRSIRAALGLTGGKRADSKYLGWFGPGNVLDIGCGDRLRTSPPQVPFGIELSTALHARADAQMRARGGYCLHAAGADGVAQFEPAMFSGIIMHSYLEHETAVAAVLSGAWRALRPGGKVYVRVPNYGSLNRRLIGAKWCGFRHPDHVNYFTLPSLRRAAAKAGFDTHLLNRVNLWIDDNIHVLLAKPA